MKITFIAPGIGISGGVKAIFEFANHLRERGHDVSVVYPRPRLRWVSIRGVVGHVLVRMGWGNKVDWFDLKARLTRVPALTEKYIPDGDVVVATLWRTAYDVSKYGKSKGEKFYLVQHYETWCGPEAEVNQTYRLGLHNVVNSTWLKDILENKLKVPVEALILHAPDWTQFYPEPAPKSHDHVRVLMLYHRDEWKGSADGIKAYEIARRKCPNLQLVMFGLARGKDVPEYAEFHASPHGEKLRKIYNSSDIFVFPSHYEGFGMPPMEAMACKVAVVATEVGAIPEYSISGKTALLSPPHRPELLAESIIKLAEDEKLRKGLAEAGYEHIRNFTWDKATDQLEQVFKKVLLSERSLLTKDHNEQS